MADCLAQILWPVRHGPYHLLLLHQRVEVSDQSVAHESIEGSEGDYQELEPLVLADVAGELA